MDVALTEPTAERTGEGSPSLQLDGFSGPLERLLNLARTQRIDLARLSVPDLVAQLTAALEQAGGDITLGQKGGWVVMAAWLVWLRSRLLLPDRPQDAAADGEGARLRDRLLALHEAQALAGWLEGRPQLGYDVFARGQPEFAALPGDAGAAVANSCELDVVAFLWAGLARFDDTPKPSTTASPYRPPWLDLSSVVEARERIRRVLAEASEPTPLPRLVPPDDAADEGRAKSPLRRRSDWASTLVACLELTKQGEAATTQDGSFAAILVSRIPAAEPTGRDHLGVDGRNGSSPG